MVDDQLDKYFELNELQKGEEDTYLDIGATAWNDIALGRKAMEKEVETFFENPSLEKGICLTLKHNSQIVGTAFVVERQHDLEGVDIFNIAIHPDYQKKGFGLHLMNLLFKKAVEYNKKWVFISTSEDLVPFYVKSGMTEFGRISKARIGMDRVYLFKKIL